MAKQNDEKTNKTETKPADANQANPKPFSTAEKIAHFTKYQKLDDDLRAAQERVEKLLSERTELVKAIFAGAGSGPFNWKGSVLSITKRTMREKDEKGNVVKDGKILGESWFFKGNRAPVEAIG